MPKMGINQGEIAAIKDLASENVTEILDDLGIVVTDRGSYYAGSCPVHKGDNRGGFTVRKDGYWKCWTKSCHTDNGSDLIGLIRSVKECGFLDAYNYLVDLLKINLSELDRVKERADNKKFTNEIMNAAAPETTFDELDGSFVEDKYLPTRKFLKESLDYYGIKYCNDPDHSFYRRTVIPVRNSAGLVVGFTGRTVAEITQYNPKWRHEGLLHRYLFNYSTAKNTAKELQWVVLTEGPLASIRLREAGISNSISVLGGEVSSEQLKALLEMEVFQVVLCFDNDEAGVIATKKAKELLSKYFYLITWDITPHHDLDEMSVAEIKQSFEGVKCQL